MTTGQARVVEDVSHTLDANLHHAVARAALQDGGSEAVRAQRLHRAVLQHAGFCARAERIRVEPLDHDARQPGRARSMRHDQTRRARPEHADLRIQPLHSRVVASLRKAVHIASIGRDNVPAGDTA
jgi:hypothetical protein